MTTFVNSIRYIALAFAIAVIATLTQHFRDQQIQLAAEKVAVEQGVPRIMSGPTVDDLICNFRDRGIPISEEMFQP